MRKLWFPLSATYVCVVSDNVVHAQERAVRPDGLTVCGVAAGNTVIVPAGAADLAPAVVYSQPAKADEVVVVVEWPLPQSALPDGWKVCRDCRLKLGDGKGLS